MQAQKPTLPSFWTPSLTPTVDLAQALAARKKSKTSPMCPASSVDESHPLSQKQLISVDFSHEESGESKKPRRLCPSCMKMLSNASRPVLAKSCGHVFCRLCVTRLLRSPEQPCCYVCDASLGSGRGEGGAPVDKKAKTWLPDGLVELRTDGTGFSAAGSSIVERVTTNFQC
jgi:nitric oxide synthase-interacting protein